VEHSSLGLTLWWSLVTALLVSNKIFENLKVDLQGVLVSLIMQWKANIFFGSFA
jgi:hypothetical protein